MARFSRLAVLNSMVDIGLVPVFYNPNPEVAKRIVEACAQGGAKLVEFTNRGDHAVEVFNELERYTREHLPGIVLGVGSVIDPGTAVMYIAQGTNFVVGPLLNPEVARICNRRKIAYLPGCGTASEISQAEELGCEIVKIFPAGQVGGPAFVKAILGPCPWVSMMPTGAVDRTEESLKAWFEAGIVCVGMGSKLIDKELVKAGDFAGIKNRVQQTLELIRQVRQEL